MKNHFQLVVLNTSRKAGRSIKSNTLKSIHLAKSSTYVKTNYYTTSHNVYTAVALEIKSHEFCLCTPKPAAETTAVPTLFPLQRINTRRINRKQRLVKYSVKLEIRLKTEKKNSLNKLFMWSLIRREHKKNALCARTFFIALVNYLLNIFAFRL